MMIVLDDSSNSVKRAADFLRRGKIVAFPTETVYGLGANVFNARAVERIYEVKGRPKDNPMIVHICFISQLNDLVKEVSNDAKKLIKSFWPGPLTLVFDRSEKVPSVVSAGLDSVAVRMPSHRVALKILKEAGFPIAAPSANISGRPSATSAAHVLEDFKDKIEAVVDGGRAIYGLESTVLDVRKKPYLILRPGAITKEDIEKKIGKRVFYWRRGEVRAPGMKYKHYSPRAEVVVLDMPVLKFIKFVENYKAENSEKRVVAIGVGNTIKRGYYFYDSVDKLAVELFSVFRKCDSEGVNRIFVKSVKEKGIGVAVMNRIKKAAGV